MYQIHDVFISYRRREADGSEQGTKLAETIYKYLKSKGLRVFLDRPEMDVGEYEKQIPWQLEHSPNYVFIATNAAMHFRDEVKDGKDLLAREVKLAVELYEKSSDRYMGSSSIDRVLTLVVPPDATFPKDGEDARFPEEIRKLTRQQGVTLSGSQPSHEELGRLLRYITKVNNRGNMWNAGHRWFERAKEPGSRFANLRIDQMIMPLANTREVPEDRLPIRAHLEGEDSFPLMDKIRDTEGHLYLVGEGGIGKTTALFSIMESVYGPDAEGELECHRTNGQVPLFVELSRAPDTYGKLYEGGRSTFIHRSIYQQLRQDLRIKQISEFNVSELDEVFNIDPETAVRPIHDLFTLKNPAPEYLLLLDGLNEVSRVEIEHTGEPRMKESVISMILQEIRQLIEECPNVRVILTSRTKEQAVWGNRTTMLYLSGVDDGAIVSYLRSRKLPETRIIAAKQSEKLQEILRIPLFLTLYASLEGEEEIRSRGEILQLFFHQKRDALYTVKGRSDAVNEDVAKVAAGKQYHRMDASMQSFILDFILPEIAWHMVQADEFYLGRDGFKEQKGIDDIIEHVLTDKSETAVIGKYGFRTFTSYQSASDAGQNTMRVAKAMCDRLGEDMFEVIDSILNCSVMTLGILQLTQSSYGFIHHHIRDYFAAIHQINRLRLAVYVQGKGWNENALKCLSDLKENPLPIELRRFIGEALGEAHNAPTCDAEGNWHYVVPDDACDRNLIKRGFDIFRNRFDGEDGYCVWNLLQILKEVRRDLSGENFSALDLINCLLNGIVLGRNGCSASFNNAKINDRLFIAGGHSHPIKSVGFSADDRYVFTMSENAVRIWDVQLFHEISMISVPEGDLNMTAFSPDGTRIITSTIRKTRYTEDGEAKKVGGITKIWDIKNRQEVATLEGYKAIYSPDSKYIMTFSNEDQIILWDAQSGQKIRSLGTLTMDNLLWAVFSSDSKHFLVVYDDETYSAQEWDIQTLREIPLREDEDFANSEKSNYSPDRRYYIRQSENGTAQVMDMESGLEIGVINRLRGWHDSEGTAMYSHDGKYIAIACGVTVKIFDALTLQEIGALRGNAHSTYAAVFSPDGKRIAAASEEGIVKIWDAKSYKRKGTLQGHEDAVLDIVYSKDGEYIVTASRDGTVRIWNAEKCRQINVLRVDEEDDYEIATAVAISPDNKYIAIATYWSGIIIWEIKKHSRFVLQERRAGQVAFTPNGMYLVISGDDFIEVWNAGNWRRIDEEEIIYSAIDVGTPPFALNSSGEYIVIGTETYISVQSVKELGVMRVLEGKAKSVAYSPDGGNIASVSGSEITVWSLWDSKPIRSRKIRDTVDLVAYSLDGQCIMVTSYNGTIRVFDAQTLEYIHTMHNIPGMELLNCDLRDLHPKSQLSNGVRKYLHEYGAILDR